MKELRRRSSWSIEGSLMIRKVVKILLILTLNIQRFFLIYFIHLKLIYQIQSKPLIVCYIPTHTHIHQLNVKFKRNTIEMQKDIHIYR